MNRNQSMLYYGFKKQLPKSKMYFIHNPRTGGKYIKKSNLLQDTIDKWFVAGAKKDKEAYWWREKELKGQKVD